MRQAPSGRGTFSAMTVAGLQELPGRLPLHLKSRLLFFAIYEPLHLFFFFSEAVFCKRRPWAACCSPSSLTRAYFGVLALSLSTPIDSLRSLS
ncbi:hypothetical protein B0T25DRAFT_484079 [Lasiosphaeria hispida]|uniref:Uncharacterized protein n=1 Tax=Lasiosphaeria hispida TaxID=260671 RepID=A0AAJ0HB14_9PEZI|nr:hypothetical protein B0T25DRAFT_484079 [Lasiosphaeria hispida]